MFVIEVLVVVEVVVTLCTTLDDVHASLLPVLTLDIFFTLTVPLARKNAWYSFLKYLSSLVHCVILTSLLTLHQQHTCHRSMCRYVLSPILCTRHMDRPVCLPSVTFLMAPLSLRMLDFLRYSTPHVTHERIRWALASTTMTVPWMHNLRATLVVLRMTPVVYSVAVRIWVRKVDTMLVVKPLPHWWLDVRLSKMMRYSCHMVKHTAYTRVRELMSTANLFYGNEKVVSFRFH